MGNRGRLSPGKHERVNAVERLHGANFDDLSTKGAQHRDMLADVALERQHAHAFHYQPRSANRCSSDAVSQPFIAAPRPVETLATTLASSKWVAASTMAWAMRTGSSLLKMPEPTNTASAPS